MAKRVAKTSTETLDDAEDLLRRAKNAIARAESAEGKKRSNKTIRELRAREDRLRRSLSDMKYEIEEERRKREIAERRSLEENEHFWRMVEKATIKAVGDRIRPLEEIEAVLRQAGLRGGPHLVRTITLLVRARTRLVKEFKRLGLDLPFEI